LGQAGFGGGPNGDVLITLHVLPHAYFKTDGANIVLELPVSMKEAVLGAKITVPTLQGKVRVSVPPYSSSGDKLRLKNKGIPSKSGQGDEIVVLKIVAPTKPQKALEEALSSFEDTPVRTF
jgi:DnaJ-class molecular chaperone